MAGVFIYPIWDTQSRQTVLQNENSTKLEKKSLNAFWFKQSDRSRSRQRSIRSDEKERVLMFTIWPIIRQRNAKTLEIRNITKSVQNACREVPHKICSIWQQKISKNYTWYNYFTSKTYCRRAWHCSLTSRMRHGRGLIKNLSMKSDFYQTHPSRSGFDSECEAFRGVDSKRN